MCRPSAASEMATARFCPSFLASATAPATQPAGPQTVAMPLWLLAIGLCTLVVWIFRRSARPAKLQLAATPGRPNRLTPAHIVVAFFAWIALLLLARKLFPGEYYVLGLGLAQCLWLAAGLLVAARTFSGGLRSGLGLNLRHWFYDTARGLIGYLAVLPLCTGTHWLTLWLITHLMPEAKLEPHEMLLAMRQMKTGWLIIAVFSATVLAPLAEEVFFRGLLQSAIRRATHRPWAAVLLASLFFALVHTNTWQDMPALFVLAVVMGYNYERCGRLGPAILIHALFNSVNIAVWLHAK